MPLVASILDAGSDQPHQKADQHKSAKQHGPIPHVERKKKTVCRNLHIREHDLALLHRNELACLINLPRWRDPGCDPNATTANFVLSFSFDSVGLRFGRAMRIRL